MAKSQKQDELECRLSEILDKKDGNDEQDKEEIAV